ncbi:MAG TPA: nuclear transport factor 2 family protein [Terriglobales bacterium]|nr:nuclear transport factor 2 family protein [Terriglobales bacterium]
MKIDIWFVVIAAFATPLCHNAVAAGKQSTPASEVLTLEQKWNDVYKRSDVATMNILLADDYIITTEDGSTFSKMGYIAHNGNSTVQVDVSKMSDLMVRMHGNTAVVTGAYYEKGVEDGKDYEYHDRLTDVWLNSKGRWQLIASHYSLAGH